MNKLALIAIALITGIISISSVQACGPYYPTVDSLKRSKHVVVAQLIGFTKGKTYKKYTYFNAVYQPLATLHGEKIVQPFLMHSHVEYKGRQAKNLAKVGSTVFIALRGKNKQGIFNSSMYMFRTVKVDSIAHGKHIWSRINAKVNCPHCKQNRVRTYLQINKKGAFLSFRCYKTGKSWTESLAMPKKSTVVKKCPSKKTCTSNKTTS